MGVDLSAAIPSGSLIVIDSAPIIYFLEDHRTLAPRFAPLFERASAGDIGIAIAAITLAEVLTGPLGAGNEVLAETYRTALTQGQGWSVVPETEQIAVNAARFRARYRLKLPDALQVATVLATGAYALITHDRDFRTVRDVRVMG